MKYRVRANIILEDEREARRALRLLSTFKDVMKTIREGEPAEERSRIVFERCYHDEDLAKPCETIEEYTS